MNISPCCSVHCNIFSIIDQEILHKHNVRLLPVTKPPIHPSLLDGAKNPNNLDLIMVKNKNYSIKDNENLNNMFWSWWLFACKAKIANLTEDELDDLKIFMETKSSSHGVRIRSEDATVSNIPPEFLTLLQNEARVPIHVSHKRENIVYIICLFVICAFIAHAYDIYIHNVKQTVTIHKRFD